MVSTKRALLTLLLVVINTAVLGFAPIASGIQALGSVGGAGFAVWIVSFVSLYTGLFIAKAIANYGKLDVSI